jgi:hypothetical protein
MSETKKIIVNQDFDGVMFEPKDGIAITLKPTSYENIPELPPGTFIFDVNSKYLNNVNKNSIVVCTNLNTYKCSATGYFADNMESGDPPKNIELNPEFIDELKELAPFVGKDNFENLIGNTNLYTGDSFCEPAMGSYFLKTHVPGLYQTAMHTYQWIDKDSLAVLNQASTYGIIPATKQATEPQNEFTDLTKLIVQAVQSNRVGTDIKFDKSIKESDKADLKEKLENIVKDNTIYYSMDKLKTMPIDTGIKLFDNTLKGDIVLTNINHQSNTHMTPFSIQISEKDFLQYFNMYDTFNTSLANGFELGTDLVSLNSYRVNPRDHIGAADTKSITLSGTKEAFGETIYNAYITDSMDNNICHHMYCKIDSATAMNNKTAVDKLTNILKLSELDAPYDNCHDNELKDKMLAALHKYEDVSSKQDLVKDNIGKSEIIFNWDEHREFLEELKLAGMTENDNDYDDYE